MRITVTENGPYIVSGDVPLVRLEIVTNEQGESVAWRETARIEAPYRYMLCRCGHSADKPFCDGTHVDADFEGTETAGHTSFAELAVPIDGPGVRLHDVRRLCAEARYCDRAGGLWNLVDRCADPETRALAEEESRLCPSGRYVMIDAETGEPCEDDLEPSIGVVEDPHLGVSGPYFVRGGVRVHDATGEQYEVRNRVTLCRCGHSSNKPFCDGSHVTVRFRDENAASSNAAETD
jgi:CDGSH-type Zn-finger protein